MTCKNCGANKFVEKNGKKVCEYCGSEVEVKSGDYVTQEDYDRYHRLLNVPMKDMSDEDLLWCYNQTNQNDEDYDEIWLNEIEYRKLKL